MLHTLNLAKVKHVVMEISSHAIDLYRVNDVDVNIAIYTNLTEEHLDYHGNIKSYFKTKLKIRGMLMPTAATPYVAIRTLFVASLISSYCSLRSLSLTSPLIKIILPRAPSSSIVFSPFF